MNPEPGFGTPARHPDDRIFYPVRALGAAGVPAFLMFGPTTPDQRHNDPALLARVAADFPQLRLRPTTATGPTCSSCWAWPFAMS